MNKMVLLFIGLGMVAASTNCGYKIQPVTAAQVAKSFGETEAKHCSEWIDYKAKKHADMFNLIKRQHQEKAALMQEKIDAVAAISSQDEAEKTIFEFFKKCYDLARKHREGWKALCDKAYKTAQDIYEKHKAEDESFGQYTQENDFMPLKPR